jgi:DNA-binding MarR family transcriptional regulator
MTTAGPLRDNAPESPAPTPLLKLEEFLPHRLNVLSSLVSHALTRVYGQRYGIGIPEWRVLVTLGEYGTMTGKQIGAHTHMHKTKVSRAVAQLEQRKFVQRRANRADLREAFLSLTPSGRGVYDEAAPIALEFTNRLSEVVAPADRAAFDRAMRQLTERSAKLVVEIEGGKS